MTVLPGSLNYLYYQGILDHIPFEAYDMPYAAPLNETVSPQISGSQLKQAVTGNINGNNLGGAGLNNGLGAGAGINSINNYSGANNYYGNNTVNASQYLDSAKQGMIYNAYGSGDYFVRTGNGGINYGNSDVNASGFGSVNNLKAQVLNEENDFKNNITKEAKGSKDPIFGSSPWKGLIAAGLVILTPILIGRRIFKKKP